MIVTAVPRPAGINTCLEPAKHKKNEINCVVCTNKGRCELNILECRKRMESWKLNYIEEK